MSAGLSWGPFQGHLSRLGMPLMGCALQSCCHEQEGLSSNLRAQSVEVAPLKAVTGVCIKPALFYYSHFVFLPVTNLIMLRSVNLGWHKSVLLKYFT